MIRRVALASFMIWLTGCATFGQMEQGLNALMWHDVQTAFNVLGYPSGKQEFRGDTVYYWSVSSSGALFLPQTSTITGNVGMTPFSGTTTYNQVVPVNYNCLIKIITDQSGTINSWGYDGNIGGCGHYIRRLNDYYDNNK